MAITYNRTNWQNKVTPVNETNMNNIEQGIVDCAEAINAGSGSTITVDAALSATSENPVQNKVVTAALDGKIDKVSYVDGFWYGKLSGASQIDKTDGTIDFAPQIERVAMSDDVYTFVHDITDNKLNCTPINLTTTTNDAHIVELLTYIRKHQTADTIKMYYLSAPVNFNHTISATDSTPAYSVRTTVAAAFTALYRADGSIKINSIYSDGGVVVLDSNNAITAISPTTRIAFDYNETDSYRPVALGTAKKYTDDKSVNKLDAITITLTGATAEEKRTELLTKIRSNFTSDKSDTKLFWVRNTLRYTQHIDAGPSNPEYDLVANFTGLVAVLYLGTDNSMYLQGILQNSPSMVVDGSNNITLIGPSPTPLVTYSTTTQTYRPVALDTMKLYVADAPEAVGTIVGTEWTFDFSKGQMLTANIERSGDTTIYLGVTGNNNAKYVGRTVSACITNTSTSAAITITFDSVTGITPVVGVEGGSADSLSIPALKTVKLNATLLKTAAGFVVYIEYKQIN